ncbi:MAG: ornithine aminomutase subunit alpha [Oscillospiraceae bacterium]|nr:ornithine aminomutase subunit alpha [Oscillospiraceae bacterium]
MKRNDDYLERRAHLADLTDKQLEERFWELANKLVDPLLQMGYEYTSPAVERSVLLRMGFSSIEAKAIVEGCIEHELMSHGAGNVVYRLSRAENMELREAGVALSEGKLWEQAEKLFEGGNEE